MKLFMLVCSCMASLSRILKIKPPRIDVYTEDVSCIPFSFGPYQVERTAHIDKLIYDNQVLLQCFNSFGVKYFLTNDKFIVAYKNSYEDKIKIKIYNLKGEETKKYETEKFKGCFSACLKDNFLYAVSTEDEESAFLKEKKAEKSYLRLNDAVIFKYDLKTGKVVSGELYGGCQNDSFTDIFIIHDKIYALGLKDQNSGYDFGYGGAGGQGYILALLNTDLEMIKYLTFADKIINYQITGEKIIVYTKSDLFKFDLNLNQEEGLSFAGEEALLGTKCDDLVGIVTQKKFILYDFKKNLKLAESPEFNMTFDKVTAVNDFYYFMSLATTKKMCFYLASMIKDTYIYDYNEIEKVPKILPAFPNALSLKSIIYENSYNVSSFGSYSAKLDYGSMEVPVNVVVLKRANVRKNSMYPVGYQLLFSGTGYLNGEEILNNHQITQEGDYELKLVGRSEEEVIPFKVKRSDILYYDEQMPAWDYTVKVNEKLYVDIYLEENLGTIEKVIVDKKEVDFKYDTQNKVLTLSFQETKPGLYPYYMEKIIYQKDGITYDEMIDQKIYVKVLADKISLNANFTDDQDYYIYNCEILNLNQDIRYLKLFDPDDTENTFLIPFKNGTVRLDKDLKGKKKMDLILVYSIGDLYYEEVKLFGFLYDFTKNKFADLDVYLEEGTMQSFAFKLNKSKSVKEITVNDEQYLNMTTNTDYKLIVISTSVVVVGFILLKIGKTIFKKKKRKSNQKEG